MNTELIELYWRVGDYLHRKIESAGWAKGTVMQLAAYIAQREPGLRGFSPQNLWRMRQFFVTYRDEPKLSPLVRVLPWTHNLIILGQSPNARRSANSTYGWPPRSSGASASWNGSSAWLRSSAQYFTRQESHRW